MQFSLQRLYSTHSVDILTSCCSASSKGNKQQKIQVGLGDELSSRSQATASSGASSVDSSIQSGPVESPPTPPSTCEYRIVKSSLKRQSASSCISNEKRVTFVQHVVEHRVISRHELSEDELNARWLCGDEYASITKSCLKQIKKLEQGTHLRNQKYCARGLETHTQLAVLATVQIRRAAWDAVFSEQDEQKGLGVIDDEAVALLYQDVSSSCQLWAVKMGLDDQRDAQLIYDNML